MKKSILLATLAAVTMLIAGCASQPKFANLTGTWNYSFLETGKSDKDTGKMELKQDCFKLSGKANDGFGQFAVTGSIEGAKVVIDGKRDDGKRSFTIKATVCDENSFEGTYSTDQKTSGEISAKRFN